MLEQDFYEQKELWHPERWLQGHQLQRLTTCLQMLPIDTQSLLDVGAGNGAFLSLVERRVAAEVPLVGVERSAAAIAAAVCLSPLTQGLADALPYADRAFDLVSALELIEHLPWGVYEQTLVELQRVADRYVLIDVPYREKRLHVKCPYCDCHFNPYFHMRVFDDTDLAGLLPGFKLAGVKRILSKDSLLRVATLPFRKQVFGGFPTTAICPQCGFRKAPSHSEAVLTEVLPNSPAGLVQALAKVMPSIETPTEVVALFERIH